MQKCFSVAARGIVMLVASAGALPALGQSVQQTAHINANGAWTQSVAGPELSPPEAGGVLRSILWTYNDPAAIPQMVALADTTNESWVAENLNSMRLSYYATNGDGTPIWEYPVTPDDLWLGVASAEDASLGVIHTLTGGVRVLQAFTRTGGATPVWTYTFDADYPLMDLGAHSIDLAADGHLVLAAAEMNGTPQSLLVTLNGVTGAEISRRVINAYVHAVELSDDGTRAVLTEVTNVPTIEVIDTATLQSLFTFTDSNMGAGGTARMSRNGRVVVAGGFNYRAFRESGGTWTPILSGSASGEWYGWGLSVSGDGNSMFVVSHNYISGYLQLTYQLFDLVSGTLLHSITTQGSGAYQDSVQWAEMSNDGQVMACISWGTEDVAHPQTQVFDRQLNLIGSITSPGSPFAMDMSRDGRYVLVGAKHVHANVFGNGGDVYVFELPVGMPGDLNCDGAVNFNDINPFVLALSDPAGYARQYPNCNILNGDINGDGHVDFADINPFVALLTH